jgi:hypothetical protein
MGSAGQAAPSAGPGSSPSWTITWNPLQTPIMGTPRSAAAHSWAPEPARAGARRGSARGDVVPVAEPAREADQVGPVDRTPGSPHAVDVHQIDVRSPRARRRAPSRRRSSSPRSEAPARQRRSAHASGMPVSLCPPGLRGPYSDDGRAAWGARLSPAPPPRPSDTARSPELCPRARPARPDRRKGDSPCRRSIPSARCSSHNGAATSAIWSPRPTTCSAPTVKATPCSRRPGTSWASTCPTCPPRNWARPRPTRAPPASSAG